MSKISKNIKKYRKLADMTQEDLAVRIHVTRQTVSSWETDRTQPDLSILQSLAEAFGIEIEELIYGKKRNIAEEREKQLFGNTLVTVLSVLGCLLIGAGVVLIFVKFWQDMPEMIKIFTCFVPALLGQGIGIYTYSKKKESIPWREGASVLWLLGVGVTSTVIISNVSFDRYVVSDSWFYMFMAVSALVLMVVFRTLSPLAVAHFFSVASFNVYIEDNRLYALYIDTDPDKAVHYIIAVLVYAAAVALCFYLSSRLYKKENDIIRHTFASWVNLIGLAVLFYFVVESTNLRYNAEYLLIIAAAVLFIIGQKHTDFVSPYRVLGLPSSAAALCCMGIYTFGAELSVPQWMNILTLVLGLVPGVFLIVKKTRPENIYIRAYGFLFTAALFVQNLFTCIDKAYYIEEADFGFEGLTGLGNAASLICFFIALAGLVMLVVYGARERKLIYLNLGFVLSCVMVIARLYILDLGLIVTGILLILCGAGLLAINLKISRLREKETAQALSEAEEGAQ